MRRFSVLLAVLVAFAVAAPAGAAPSRTASLSSGGFDSFSWRPQSALGLNTTFLTARDGRGTCGWETGNRCDDSLIRVADAGPAETLAIAIDAYDPAASDFDLRVYESDANANAVRYLGPPESATPAPLAYGPGDAETKEVPAQDGDYFLIRVVYVLAPNASYQGTATLR